jgi:hypothetical protein
MFRENPGVDLALPPELREMGCNSRAQ